MKLGTTKNGYTQIDYNNPEIKRAVDLVTTQNAHLIERDVLELTGVPKEPNEKYYTYLKRAVKVKFQEYQDQIYALQKEVA